MRESTALGSPLVASIPGALNRKSRIPPLKVPSDVSVNLLKVDPFYDRLRGHPRFRALMEEYGPTSPEGLGVIQTGFTGDSEGIR